MRVNPLLRGSWSTNEYATPARNSTSARRMRIVKQRSTNEDFRTAFSLTAHYLQDRPAGESSYNVCRSIARLGAILTLYIGMRKVVLLLALGGCVTPGVVRPVPHWPRAMIIPQ